MVRDAVALGQAVGDFGGEARCRGDEGYDRTCVEEGREATGGDDSSADQEDGLVLDLPRKDEACAGLDGRECWRRHWMIARRGLDVNDGGSGLVGVAGDGLWDGLSEG